MNYDRAYYNPPPDPKPDPISYPCSTCRGRCDLSPDEPCRVCDGTGELPHIDLVCLDSDLEPSC